MGNAGVCAENPLCQSGLDFIDTLTNDDATATPSVQPSALRFEERRWVPESLYRSRLLLGKAAEPEDGECTGPDPQPTASGCWLVLLGEGGRVLAVLGEQGLTGVGGVQLERHDGIECFGLRLKALSHEVHGLLLVAAGPAQDAVGLLSEHANGQEESRLLCWFHPEEETSMKSAAPDKLLVLLALHSGLRYNRPWAVESVGRVLPSAPGGPMLTVGSLAAELVARARRFFQTGHMPIVPLPECRRLDEAMEEGKDPAEPAAEPDTEVMGDQLLEERRNAVITGRALLPLRQQGEVLRERRKRAKRRFEGAFRDLQSLQGSLDAWQETAALKAKEGDAKGVWAMLPQLPSASDERNEEDGDGDVAVEPIGKSRVPPKSTPKTTPRDLQNDAPVAPIVATKA